MSCQDVSSSAASDTECGGRAVGTTPYPKRTQKSSFAIGSPRASSPIQYDCGDDDHSDLKIRLGVCAMAKKANSRPMQEILKRLSYFSFLEIVVFEEQVILNKDVEDWPIVDSLMAFYSANFPLEKAVKYENLRKPYTINNLQMQYSLMNRRVVHEMLEKHGVVQPKYAVMDRDKNSQSQNELIEYDDHIEVNGVVFHKPFVEKPLSADDHNVYIYYPSSAGGGSQRLFRKIGKRSSVYSPVSRVRTVGSYLYEEFMPTDGTDVKIYTVGADYAHAEARKAPALDGKVERDKNGKEVRYPVILSAREKMIARAVCTIFKQDVCGFDLLRANGVSYVCDVNGFSFVKTSSKYYDDCATVLASLILKQLAPQLKMLIPPELADPKVPTIVPTTYGTMMELRCVIAVIRHADRTPKQKMKMEVKHPRFFALFEKYGGHKTGALKLKRPHQLQEVLDIARVLLDEIDKHVAPPELEEKKNKFMQLKSVLEMYGHFSGINRKIQIKYQPHGFISASSADEVWDYSCREPSLVLILKWGGELTAAGKQQAEELGKAFRCIYPNYGETPGLGLLRLHSTYRHDLKIYASDEGRVQITAAAFAKGFLALEGELTPILVQMVKSGSHTNGLLDNAYEQPIQQQAKQALQEILNKDSELSDEDYEKINPCRAISIDRVRDVISNPYATLAKLSQYINKLLKRLKSLKLNPKYCDKVLYHGESLELMWRRWWKLEKDFTKKNGQYDVCKIPDIYDNIKYDLQHNSSILDVEEAEDLVCYSKALADIVVPQEYGLTETEKVSVGGNIAKPLLRKIKVDLLTNAQEAEDYTRLDSRFSMGVISPDRHVRTRLYFTSESHIHSLVSLINHGGLTDACDDQWLRAQEYISGVSELNYLSQIVIMMYEDPTKDRNSDERFHIEVHFSPGAYGVELTAHENKERHRTFRGYQPNKNRTSALFLPEEAVQEIIDDDDEFLRSSSIEEECENLFEPSLSQQVSEEPLDSHELTSSESNTKQHDLDRLSVKSDNESPFRSSSPILVKSRKHSYSCVGLAHSTSPHKRHHSTCGNLFTYHSHSPPSPGSALISTKVISGSISAPNLHNMNETKALETYGLAVPEIMPLETLHNALTLRHFDKFLTNMIDMESQSPRRLYLYTSYSSMPASLSSSPGADATEDWISLLKEKINKSRLESITEQISSQGIAEESCPDMSLYNGATYSSN